MLTVSSLIERFGSLSTFKKCLIAYLFYKSFQSFYSCITAKSLRNEIALITGAGSGLGRLLSIELSKKYGAKIALIDINKEAVEGVAEEITKAGGVAKAYQCDVSDPDRVKKLAIDIEKDFGGPVYLLVNNAGIVSGKKLLDPGFSEERAVATFKVNSIALLWTIRAFLPSMLSNNRGHIVNVASMAGHVGQAGLVDYCGSKFAAVGIDESVRQLIRTEKKWGVKTTCVCPFYINTGMFDGVKVPWYISYFFPIMEPSYVIQKMIYAIRTNESMLCLPLLSNTSLILRPFLPTSTFDWVIDSLLDMNSAMKEFKGNNASFQRS